ncbi:MAG: metal-dependent transcriptional regulator [Verrucomicrobiae bacterium]|nr:metal-dependent transcriptional regulator [Verrucomicrobiae bacterium]NNJ43695.1 metal-dependent transcriptional regulator [Akkermansiaceae bacterium]
MANDRRSHREIELEDALKHLFDCEEVGSAASVDSLSGALQVRGEQSTMILGRLRSQGLAEPRGDVWLLTEDGQKSAMAMVRRHRLYETWLAQEEGVPIEELHRRAQVEEHLLSLDQVDAFANKLGNPRFDPHGDPIPTRDGEIPMARRVSLAEWDLRKPAMIEHVEDEPVSMYRGIVKDGLYAGMVLMEMESLPDGGVSLTTDGRKLVVAPELLGMIHVDAVDQQKMMPEGVSRLSELAVGEEGVVYGLSAACYGPERRRLLDIGIVPGTRIRCQFQSPFGSPRSYQIRGALFGFRDEQADKVLLAPSCAATNKNQANQEA